MMDTRRGRVEPPAHPGWIPTGPGANPDAMDTATYNPESNTFTLKAQTWFDTYPISDLPKWLRFYRRMKSDFPKSGSNYDGAIAALERLAAELGIEVPK